MKKIYRSKVGLSLLVSSALILLALIIFTLLKGSLFITLPVFILLAFILYLCRSTFYEVKGNKLKVKSGFLFNREIYVNSIRRIRPSKDHSASPALSNDRLEIIYNRYGSILVSPEHCEEFIEELKKINPRIDIERTR